MMRKKRGKETEVINVETVPTAPAPIPLPPTFGNALQSAMSEP